MSGRPAGSPRLLSMVLTATILPLVAGCGGGPLGTAQGLMNARDAAQSVRAVNQMRATEQPIAGTFQVEAQFPDTTFTFFLRTSDRRIAPLPREGERTLADRALGRERLDWEAGFFTSAGLSWTEEGLSGDMMEMDYPGFLIVEDTRELPGGDREFLGLFFPIAEEGDPFFDRFAAHFGWEGAEAQYGFRVASNGHVTFSVHSPAPDGSQAHIRGRRVSEEVLEPGSDEEVLSLETVRYYLGGSR